MADTIHIEGYCPLLTCLKTKPHDHPICPDCGAVRYGNLGCKTCNQYHADHPDEGPERD